MTAMAMGLLPGCVESPSGPNAPVSTLFIGIDAGGSFRTSGHYENALSFLSHYIYGHINALGGLDTPQALFVTSMGGKELHERKNIHSLHEFEGKSVPQIEADLKQWFPPVDAAATFNPFFQEIGRITREQGLTHAPITVMIISDGMPGSSGAVSTAGTQDLYGKIDLTPLEQASRHVTLRLAYVSPKVGAYWRAQVPRHSMRLWTVDTEVMNGWKTRLKPGVAPHAQADFWRWLHEDVDVRIRARI
jgi:hypothetical protein